MNPIGGINLYSKGTTYTKQENKYESDYSVSVDKDNSKGMD